MGAKRLPVRWLDGCGTVEITPFQDIIAVGLDSGLPRATSVAMIGYSNIPTFSSLILMKILLPALIPFIHSILRSYL